MTSNRVPEERLGDGAKCGKCSGLLFTGEPVAVDEAGFRKMIGFNDIPVIVDFWASWCGPCKMFAPVYAEAAAQLEPRFWLLKVDTEAAPKIASQYRIQSIPTIAVFKDGREFTRQAGAMPLSQFVSWVDSNVKESGTV